MIDETSPMNNIEDIKKRFAEVNQISEEETERLIGANTVDEVMENIKNFTTQKIRSNMVMNRAQRRKIKKKAGMKKFDLIADTTKKLNMINLIRELRKLNEEKEREIERNEVSEESNLHV